jgi:hypothetical protein
MGIVISIVISIAALLIAVAAYKKTEGNSNILRNSSK